MDIGLDLGLELIDDLVFYLENVLVLSEEGHLLNNNTVEVFGPKLFLVKTYDVHVLVRVEGTVPDVVDRSRGVHEHGHVVLEGFMVVAQFVGVVVQVFLQNRLEYLLLRVLSFLLA